MTKENNSTWTTAVVHYHFRRRKSCQFKQKVKEKVKEKAREV